MAHKQTQLLDAECESTPLQLASELWEFSDDELDGPYVDGTASVVYVLHFATPYRHARHYIGIAMDGDVQRRLKMHMTGHGSPLVRAVVDSGIEITVSFTINGDRGLERRMHNRHGTRMCPICNGGKKY